MARLSDELITRIKRDVSLLELARTQGHHPKKQGKDYLVRCPFHDDRTPSCVISPDKNLWHCLGACGTGGSVIDWLMKTDGLSFRAAVEHLATQLTAAPMPIKHTEPAHLSPLAADVQPLLQQAIEHYHNNLKAHEPALAYLEKRGLNDPALINAFKLGFADSSFLKTLPSKHSQAGKAQRAPLQAVGWIRPSGFELLQGCLLVPVLDGDGQITDVYGRRLAKPGRPTGLTHVYLPGPHEGVWNSAAFAHEEIILCEALLDALTFWRHGFYNVTTSYGTAGFTDAHWQMLRRHGTKRVLIAYDRDAAGDQAAQTLALQLQAEGVACFRVQFPKGMDANAYALTVQPAHKSLAWVLEKAVYWGDDAAPAVTSRCQLAEVESDPAEALRRELSKVADCPGPNETHAADGDNLTVATQPTTPESLPETTSALASDRVPAPDYEQAPTPDNEATVEPSAVLEKTAAKEKTAASRSDGVTVNKREILIPLGTPSTASRLYRVRGLFKNTGFEQLKINLLVSLTGHPGCHVDTLDLYSARFRQQFIKQAAQELALDERVIKQDLGQVLLKLEELQEQQIEASLVPQDERVELSPAEHAEALALIQQPDLLHQILADFDRAGVVGEEVNKLVGYLACVSRKLDKPLAIMIQSTSAAGKSALMEAVLAMMPQEHRIQYSAMTGQSLFYMGETNLKHKILAIAEEEGVHQASYALKLLQSEGQVTIASTGKDPQSGSLVTQEYRVEGPVMLLMTTTAIDIDEELLNRCLVLSVNETRDQTQAIHALQRNSQTLDGLLADQDRQAILKRHQNAQRLLKSYRVVNPFAHQLTFLSDKTRTRRDHLKYLQLINSIALLHQHQRPIKHIEHQGETLEYLEVTPADIALANTLAHEVLGRSLDELPPQTRRLLNLIYALVQEQSQAQGLEPGDYRFSRKTIREYTGWGNTQLKLHCQRLEEMEYLLVHRGARGLRFEYELLYDGPCGSNKTLPGLIGLAQLTASGANQSGQHAGLSALIERLSGPSRPPVGGESGPCRGAKSPENTTITASNAIVADTTPKSTSGRVNGHTGAPLPRTVSRHVNTPRHPVTLS